jgi:hypothetical protein
VNLVSYESQFRSALWRLRIDTNGWLFPQYFSILYSQIYGIAKTSDKVSCYKSHLGFIIIDC